MSNYAIFKLSSTERCEFQYGRNDEKTNSYKENEVNSKSRLAKTQLKNFDIFSDFLLN